MRTYRGLARSAQKAHERKLAAEQAKQDRTAPVEAIPDGLLSGSIYRLQGLNRDGRWAERIRELVAEQARRREAR